MNKFILRIMVAMILLTFATAAIAQNMTDSLHTKSGNLLKNKFDGFKIIDVQYDEGSSSDYRMKMDDKKYEKGDLESLKRVNTRISLPIVVKSKFVISATLNYKYEALSFDNSTSMPIGVPTLSHHDREESHFYTGVASFTFFDKLFGRDIFYSASLVTDGSQRGFESLNGALAATITLRKTEHSHLSIGLYGSTSRASIFPFLPILNYTHRFTNSEWMIDAIMPSYAYIRRRVGKNGRISAGMYMDSNSSYFYPRQDGFKKRYTFNKVDVNGVILYEHFIAKNIMANARVGVSKCYGGVWREKNSKRDIVNFSQNANMIFDVGISYILGN